MKFQGQTILITGGSSGIGLELAKQLVEKGNSVLICGRSSERLELARKMVPALHTFQCDIALDADRNALVAWVETNHPVCSVLINNAAVVHKTSFHLDDAMLEKTDLEIRTNLVAPIALSKLFLRVFRQQKQSAIINITTGLIYAPRVVYPIYNATKAALHSFTQVLRQQLAQLPIDIIEVMMPVVNTPWHKGEVPGIAIPADVAVGEMIRKVEKGKKEVRVGKVWLLYALSRIAPGFAFRKINQVK